MRAHKSTRRVPWRGAVTGRRWSVLPVLLFLGGCELTDVEVEPLPDMIVAGVAVVLTVDPLDPSRVDTYAGGLVTRFRRKWAHEVPGASVRIVGESGRTLDLAEVSDPLATCLTPLLDGFRHPPAGSCYLAAEPGTHFAPGEKLTLTVTLPDGGVLTSESTMPGLFTAADLSLEGGRCRLDPNTGYRFDWARSAGSWGYIAEAKFAGLGELWRSKYPLHLAVTLRGADKTEALFPRDFLLEVSDVQTSDIYRTLREGLPVGGSAEVAVGAVDRNWANWTRVGRIENYGEVNVPSVFGDGTGWFGTAVRWKVSVESREASGPNGDDEDLPLCGPRAG